MLLTCSCVLLFLFPLFSTLKLHSHTGLFDKCPAWHCRKTWLDPCCLHLLLCVFFRRCFFIHFLKIYYFLSCFPAQETQTQEKATSKNLLIWMSKIFINVWLRLAMNGWYSLVAVFFLFFFFFLGPLKI